MKAVIIKKNCDIIFDDIQEEIMKEDEVKIKVKYTGICGSDVPRALKNGAHNYPIILGHEFSGEIIEIGSKVNNAKIGDHVVGIPLMPCHECRDCINGNYSLCKNYNFVGSRRQGSMAEHIILNQKNILVIDKNIPLLSAAFFEPSAVAYHGIDLIGLENKENACIIGSGNIAFFVFQWLKIYGVKNITIVGKNEKTLKRFLKYGANHTINTKSENFNEEIENVTNGERFYNVFECAGSSETMNMSLLLAANKGRICLIGTPKDPVTLTVKEWETINRKELTIKGSWMSYSKEFPGKEWTRTNEEFKKGNLTVPQEIIHKIYPMEKGKEAFEQYNEHISGKVIIENEFF